MLAVARNYRNPIVVTALMVAALTFWAWQTWVDIQEHDVERRQHRAVVTANAMEHTIRALAGDGHLRPERIESVLANSIRASRIVFVVLELNGRRILQAGDVPPTLTLSSAEGERLSGDSHVFWRPARLLGDIGAAGQWGTVSTSGGVAASKSGAIPTLAMGLDVRGHKRGRSKAIRGMVLTLVAALLFVAASFVAWITTTRSRLLEEQLETERTRRAHLEELGLAAAGLAHETKNPLGIILGLAQQIAKHPGEPAESRVMVEHIMDEIDKASARLGSFMTFARQRELKTAPLDAQDAVAKVGEVLRPDFDAVGVELSIDAASAGIMADEETLRQVLVNLLLNSLHASSPGNTVSVRVEHDKECARLIIEDEGIGIAPDLLPNVFKPYVAGSPEGHGLGLAIVKRCVEEHGWTIDVDSEPDCGTTITISGIGLSELEDTDA